MVVSTTERVAATLTSRRKFSKWTNLHTSSANATMQHRRQGTHLWKWEIETHWRHIRKFTGLRLDLNQDQRGATSCREVNIGYVLERPNVGAVPVNVLIGPRFRQPYPLRTS